MRWPAHGLKDAQQVFALAEAVEEDGERADVHGVRAEPDQVRLDASEFVEENAQPLGAFGDLEFEEFFHRERIGGVVGHGTEVVDAVGHRSDLGVELGLAGLLDAGVQVADVRGERDDGLAVELDDQTQHAVRGGMLRAHVQDHRLVADRVGAVGVVVLDRGTDYVLHAGSDHVFCVRSCDGRHQR
jgi:hypothetical protein